jgi:hypothetical protein
LDHGNIHRQGGQQLACTVMQLTGDPAAFLILHLLQLRGEVAQFLVSELEFSGPLVYANF